MRAIGSYGPMVPGVLGFFSLVLVVGAAYVLIEAWMLRLRPTRMYAVVSFAGAVLLSWAIDLACCLITKTGAEATKVVQVLSSVSIGWYVALLLLLAAFLGRLALLLRAERRARITPDSVKEAVDALPDGVCFSTIDGLPVLVNAQMDALAHDAFGMSVNDERVLWSRLCVGDCKGRSVVKDAGAQEGKALLVGLDGRAWQFSRRALAVSGRGLMETIATDVTEEHALLAQLDERNQAMAEMNERLRAYGHDVVRLTREEEVLAAKVRVHNEVGRALVALRVYERQDPSQRDRDTLLAQWRQMAHLLEDAGTDESPTDDWQLLCQAAEAIDVQLGLEGELPREGEARKLAILVVHECLNNAVRHGDAHRVDVTCAVRDGVVELSVTNDGMTPDVEPDEAGGLSNVRAAVERVGGMLTILWKPRVVVTARFDAED